MNIDVDLKVLDKAFYEEFTLPEYKTPESAGIDIRACIEEPILTIKPNSVVLVPSGLAYHINSIGICGFLLPRSGLGHKLGIILGNSTGIIDSDYTGQLYMSVWNRNELESIEIERGDRIAQLLFMPVYRANFNVVDELNTTHRGDKGFGHTGKQ